MQIDWVDLGNRALESLQDLLRIDTRNPPGNERPAAEYVAKKLRASGLEVRFFEGKKDRTNLVCRIKGTGQGAPLLLAGHLDVVPVEREHWDVDPFSGIIRDGYLYGRGAIDMKNHIAACMTIMQILAERGARPSRDIIFAAVCDEEEGCTWGSKYMVEEHPDEVRAEWMLGEVGGFTLYIGDTCYYPIQIAEKGRAIVRMTAHGDPGHGALPHNNMAIARLGRALQTLGTQRLPHHVTSSTERFIRAIASTQPPPASLVLPQTLQPRVASLLLDRVLPTDLSSNISALLHNTATPTILNAGTKSNVIPSTASCILDCRILPGQSVGDVVRELRDLLGRSLEFEVLSSYPGIEQQDPSSELFSIICSTLQKHDPDGIPLPYPIAGFTDAQYFSRLGARCYGFSPLRFPKADNVQFSKLFHGHNERIHVEGFRWGVHVLWDVVSSFGL